MMDSQLDEQSKNRHALQSSNSSHSKQKSPDYLGAWPVARGEDVQNYESLLSEIAGHYCPSDPIGWMRVRDIADGEWQKQRMQRAIAGSIEVAKTEAVAKVLISRRRRKELSGRATAEGYVKGCPSDRSEVLEFLQEEGLSEETFISTAIAMRATDIERMERSAMLHQACRDEAIRQLERRLANSPAGLPKPPVQDAEYRVIENPSNDGKEAA
jgi:hypothetical protein